MTSASSPGVQAASPLGVLTQHVLDALESVTAIVDADGVIVAVNRPWLDYMRENGGTLETCDVGANYLLACDRAGPAAETEAPGVARSLRAGLSGAAGCFELEYPCHSPTQEYWYQLKVRPFEARAGRYALIQHSDVTARRQAESQAADLNTQALDRFNLHTHILKTENEELDAFIGTVSHDLRTPVRHIQGFLSLLRRKIGADRWSSDELRLLDVIDGASGRLQQMIDELLKLARVSQRELQFQNVDLTVVMQDAWAGLTPEHQERDLEWRLEALPVVRGDPALLRLAFENLLGNALKYSAGRGAARISVRATPTDQGWVVSVHDNGVGFDPAHASKLFGAFQRLHSDREFSGVGIGLANVRRIVARHGGQVWAEGQVGQGTAFHVRFPVNQEAASGAAREGTTDQAWKAPLI